MIKVGLNLKIILPFFFHKYFNFTNTKIGILRDFLVKYSIKIFDLSIFLKSIIFSI